MTILGHCRKYCSKYLFFFRLKNLKGRVQEARMSSALFDTRQYTQNLETLFGKIWDRHEKGLPPDHIE